jgi:DNA-binding LacI/PurR family transcriptional regulator
MEYVTGIASVLNRERYALSLSTYPDRQSDLAVGRLSDRNFDGAIVLDQSSPELDRFLQAAAIPAVYVNVEPARNRRSLCRDEYAAARSLVELLAGLGYRRLHVVGRRIGADGHFSNDLRQTGIRDAAAAAGMVVTASDVEDWDAGFEDALAAAQVPPDAAVIGLGASTALRLMRCLPPEQPLACCDDAHLFVCTAPRLTRATFDRAALGRSAAEYLLRRLDHPDTRLDTTPCIHGVQLGASTPPLRPPAAG